MDWENPKALDTQFNEKAPLSQPEIVTDFANRASNQDINGSDILEAIASITQFAQNNFPEESRIEILQSAFNAYLDLRETGTDHGSTIKTLTGEEPNLGLNAPQPKAEGIDI